MTAAPVALRDDVSIIVSGQGGDGSLTVSNLLGSLLRQRRLNIFNERDVLSRIKGGHAAAATRASIARRLSLGDHVDLLVAFDLEGVRLAAPRLAPDGIVIFDSSDGPIPETIALPERARVYAVPFGRLAVRHLGRVLYKNSIGVAFASRALGLPDEDIRETFRTDFRRLGQAILQSNLDALELGFQLADESGLTESNAPHPMDRGETDECLLITGNQAVGLGFLAAGGRFFAGYPITPATEIMEWLERELPHFGGVVWQAEDELASINLAIGAALTGTRAMTATSGPGIALMQEGISQAGSAEVPVVIVDTQRGGPSTGLPTKVEQGDLNMMVFGGNGEFPRIVLAPGTPEDCFDLTIQALNLADRYQCPVYLALDQALSQNTVSSPPFDLDHVVIDRGARLTREQLAEMGVYRRYALTDTGVSPYTVPGTPGGMSLITGNERNEWGIVSTDAGNRVRMMDKRARKLDVARAELPGAAITGDADARIALVAMGGALGATEEAAERIRARGIPVRVFQPRTIWPVPQESIDFVAAHDRVYIVEQNGTGQLAKLLIREGADASRIRSVLRYDGRPLVAGSVADEVLGQEVRA